MKKLLLLLSAAFLFVACEEEMTIKKYMQEDGWTYFKTVRATPYGDEKYDKTDGVYYNEEDGLERDFFIFHKELNDKTLFVAIEKEWDADMTPETEYTRTKLSRLDRLTVYFDGESFNVREGRGNYVRKHYEAYVQLPYNDHKYYFNF